MRIAAVAAVVLAIASCTVSRSAPQPALAEAYDNVQGFFERYDGNRDGAISRAEAQEDPDLVLVFDKADANHDGVLDRMEFRTAARLAVNNRRNGAAAGSGE